MAGYTKAKTGSMNSSVDTGGKSVGNTPKSDKVGLLPAKEPVKGGIKKGTLPAKEPSSPGGKKTMPLQPTNFNKTSRGK
jgi:hypothetical protein